MRPVRNALICAALPTPALAQDVCDTVRPNWTGGPVSALSEAIALTATAPVLALIIATLAAWRFRNQWAGLAVVIAWTIYVSLVSFGSSPTQIAARAEGCIGSPALFIAAVAAICVVTILYTAPVRSGPPDGER